MSEGAPRARLGLVGPLPPPAGGMANQTRQLATLLRAEGMDVRVARTNEPYRPAWLGSVRGVRGLVHQIPYRRALSRLARDVDVMHVMANSGWAWFLLAAPAIVTAVRHNVPVAVNYRGGLAREFLRKSAPRVIEVLRLADALIVPSGFLQAVFAQHGIEARVIPNIVDVRAFAPPSDARRKDGTPHVVITRNLEAIYGIDAALRALALLRERFPRVRVSIAGTGPERRALERLAASLGLADVVRFTGRLEVAQMAALYGEADIALNLSRVDNTPNALLEAAACGVPIVSSDAGGIPYLVQHGESAWLVPVDSPEQAAAGMERVLRDDALRNTLRQSALALANRCSWPVVRSQWIELYEQLAMKGHRGAAVARSGH